MPATESGSAAIVTPPSIANSAFDWMNVPLIGRPSALSFATVNRDATPPPVKVIGPQCVFAPANRAEFENHISNPPDERLFIPLEKAGH